MKRNYEKTIAEYHKAFKGKHLFYTHDLLNLKENNKDTFSLIMNAVRYGCIIGYRQAMREQAKASRKARV